MPLKIGALIHAAESGDLKSIRRHLREGGDPNLADDRGLSVLRQAVFHNQLAIVRLLLANGASISGTLSCKGENMLHLAKRPVIAKVLIAAGADINACSGMRRGPIFDKLDEPKMLKFLLEQGADPNLPDQFGITPLMYAARDGYIKAVKIMLNFGGDRCSRNPRSGKTVCQYATPEVRAWLESQP